MYGINIHSFSGNIYPKTRIWVRGQIMALVAKQGVQIVWTIAGNHSSQGGLSSMETALGTSRAISRPGWAHPRLSPPEIAGTARHSAYRSQFVVVAYPWHPLHGQRVRVYGRQRRAGRQILYIEVQPGLSREIPAWMCDAAVCATISSGP